MPDTLSVYCDGGARGNPGPAAFGFAVIDPKTDKVLYQHGEKIGKATNNVAEYTAVLKALEHLLGSDHFNTRLDFYLDSQLVVNQLQGLYKIKNEKLRQLVHLIKAHENKFSSVSYHHIRREKNKLADALVNRALDNLPISAY